MYDRLPGMFIPYVDESPPVTLSSFRDRLWKATGGYCGICGNRIRNMAKTTKDHVRPSSLGHKTKYNVVATHGPCNVRKANRMPTGCELIWLDLTNSYLKANHSL